MNTDPMKSPALIAEVRRSLTSWLSVAHEGIAIAIAWGGYALATTINQDPLIKGDLPSWIGTGIAMFFWLTVVVSSFSFVVGSLKSALFPLIALTAIAPLLLMGYPEGAFVALALAITGTIVFALGFASSDARRSDSTTRM